MTDLSSSAPSRDEIDRIRRLYTEWEEAPDDLTTAALVASIPRLLTRIEWVEQLLRQAVRA